MCCNTVLYIYTNYFQAIILWVLTYCFLSQFPLFPASALILLLECLMVVPGAMYTIKPSSTTRCKPCSRKRKSFCQRLDHGVKRLRFVCKGLGFGLHRFGITSQHFWFLPVYIQSRIESDLNKEEPVGAICTPTVPPLDLPYWYRSIQVPDSLAHSVCQWHVRIAK